MQERDPNVEQKPPEVVPDTIADFRQATIDHVAPKTEAVEVKIDAEPPKQG